MTHPKPVCIHIYIVWRTKALKNKCICPKNKAGVLGTSETYVSQNISGSKPRRLLCWVMLSVAYSRSCHTPQKAVHPGCHPHCVDLMLYRDLLDPLVIRHSLQQTLKVASHRLRRIHS